MNEQREQGQDLYTSATADLSAGGVAMARESQSPSQSPINDPTPAQVYAREDLASDEPERGYAPGHIDYEGGESIASRIDPTWAIASGGLVALAGGVGGAWLYARWQRERSRPMNRLRRRALGLADLLAERIPDRDELRETAPMGGTAAATLLAGLVLARAVHLGGWGKSARDEREEKVERASEAMRQAGRLTMEQLRARWSTTSAAAAAMPRSMPSRQVPAPALGVGGFIGVAAVGYLIWRLVRRDGSNHRVDSQPWYIGSPERQEHVPNQ